jgi:hypothetical protein
MNQGDSPRLIDFLDMLSTRLDQDASYSSKKMVLKIFGDAGVDLGGFSLAKACFDRSVRLQECAFRILLAQFVENPESRGGILAMLQGALMGSDTILARPAMHLLWLNHRVTRRSMFDAFNLADYGPDYATQFADRFLGDIHPADLYA